MAKSKTSIATFLATQDFSRLERELILVFDFDGTLAPIVDQPSGVAMRAHTRRALAQLSRLVPTAVVSGRRRADVQKFLRGCGVRWFVGNHGMDWGSHSPGAAQFRAACRRWRDGLPELLGRGEDLSDCVQVEDKTYSLSLHYRASADPERTERLLWNRLLRARRDAARPEFATLRLVRGKFVINLVHAEAANKGDAVLELLQRSKRSRAWFFGDDFTDEDAFKLGRRRGVVGIRVGRASRTGAQVYLPNQRAIDRALDELAQRIAEFSR